nr:ras-related protein Rab-43 isoform X1 [Mirounga angustirostris]
MAGPGPGAGDPDEQYDFLFKLVLVGDASVGKTCVVQRFKTGAFSERQGSTIGVDFTMKTLEIQGKRVKLQIWDTAGQERFRTITQSYYRSANGAILAYDITKRSSFLSVPHWIEDVRKYAGSNIVQLLIAQQLPEGCVRGQAMGTRSAAAPRRSSLRLCRVIAGGSRRFDSERFHQQGGPWSSSNLAPHCADAGRSLTDSLGGSPAPVAPWPRQGPAAPRSPGIGFGLLLSTQRRVLQRC